VLDDERGHIHCPRATTPDLRARARFEHSSDPRPRPAGATGRLLAAAPLSPTRSALRHASLEHSFGPEGGAEQAVRGGLERAPAEDSSRPRSPPSPAPGALTRAASPDRGGRLGAQFEAQGEVLPVT
jgi:hypothetical protein